jgi:quercetin dioxygenase-like cupin family protein
MEPTMPNSKEIEAKSHNSVPQGCVLGAGEGEHLIHFRDGGNIFIKVDPVKGSNNLALGTQQLPKGSGIPVHRHPHKDEVFYVLEGSGTVTLNDVRHSWSLMDKRFAKCLIRSNQPCEAVLPIEK